eukprot:1814065-Amphidinium_carterae.1
MARMHSALYVMTASPPHYLKVQRRRRPARRQQKSHQPPPSSRVSTTPCRRGRVDHYHSMKKKIKTKMFEIVKPTKQAVKYGVAHNIMKHKPSSPSPSSSCTDAIREDKRRFNRARTFLK